METFFLQASEQTHWANLQWLLGAESALRIVATGATCELPSRPLLFFPLVEGSSGVSTLASELHAFIRSHLRHPGRVGEYFECLLAFAFSKNPEVRQWLRSVQVPAPADGGKSQTLGEMDFLLQTIPLTEPRLSTWSHWEVALKFFLADPVSGWWIGPNARDRLDLKLRRMREHQLQISQSLAAQPVLQRLGVTGAVSVEAYLCGRIFEPVLDFEPAALVEHWWVRQRDLAQWFRRFSASTNRLASPLLEWVILPKVQWLARIDPIANPPVLQSQRLGDFLNFHEKLPACLALLEQGVEVSRGFVVEDSWPQVK